MNEHRPVVRWLPGDRSTRVNATRVRCRLPARLLRAAGWDSRLVHRREDPVESGAEVLVLCDPTSPADADAARRMAALGAVVVVDLSDQAVARSDVGRWAVESASMVTARDPGLAAVVEHRDLALVPDAVEWAHPSPPISNRPGPGGPARLVWFGRGRGLTPGTGLCELDALAEVLDDLAGRRRTELVLVTEDRVGAHEFLRRRAVHGRVVDWSPWRLRSVLAAAHVALLPAAPGSARSRAPGRAITALVHGVPVVAGAVPSYEALGAGIAFGSWATNIDRLLADQVTVETVVGRGRDSIRRRFDDTALVASWGDALRAAHRRVAVTAPVG